MKLILAIVAIIVSTVGAAFFLTRPPKETKTYDQFAQCLAEKKLTMYGAYWCPHCQNEKNLFGSSIQYVPYVECTQETKKCLDAGIEGYPTWIDASGQKYSGEQGLLGLSKISGCQLP